MPALVDAHEVPEKFDCYQWDGSSDDAGRMVEWMHERTRRSHETLGRYEAMFRDGKDNTLYRFYLKTDLFDNTAHFGGEEYPLGIGEVVVYGTRSGKFFLYDISTFNDRFVGVSF